MAVKISPNWQNSKKLMEVQTFLPVWKHQGPISQAGHQVLNLLPQSRCWSSQSFTTPAPPAALSFPALPWCPSFSHPTSVYFYTTRNLGESYKRNSAIKVEKSITPPRVPLLPFLAVCRRRQTLLPWLKPRTPTGTEQPALARVQLPMKAWETLQQDNHAALITPEVYLKFS